MLGALRRIAIWASVVGSISFAVGFFGPMIWAPDANQGPLLGIFYTGPLGTLAGLALGLIREILGWKATPLELLRSRGIGRDQLLRGAAGLGGAVILIGGLRGLPAGVGRTAAASVVVGFALLWYAAVGRIPAWFRR
jgi:hypothetical protein